MFETLTEKLQGALAILGRRGTLREEDLDEALREVRLALLEADVHYKVVKEFVKAVRERALVEAVLKSITPAQQVVAIVHEELIRLLGTTPARLERASHSPTLIMLVGLQGSGKTTTAAKLAARLRKQGDKPLLIAADIYRPAAIEQLRQLGRQLNIAVYDEGAEVAPAQIVEHGLREARKIGASVAIIDTAGRLHIDEAMMREIGALKERFQPQEVLLVVDAMTGQEAVNVAKAFQETVAVTGLILTKMDGDARGGAALSIRAVTGAPVKFLGTGEKPDALEECHPDRLASRILGMGDVRSLYEKAQEEFGDQDAKVLRRRMQEGSLTLEDFLDQLQRVRKMGPVSQLLGMLPGMGRLKAQLDLADLDDSHFKRVEAIIHSMTPEERRKPEIIDGSRRRRIAAGSGATPQDVNQLLNQYKEAKKIMKAVASGKLSGLAIPGACR